MRQGQQVPPAERAVFEVLRKAGQTVPRSDQAADDGARRVAGAAGVDRLLDRLARVGAPAAKGTLCRTNPVTPSAVAASAVGAPASAKCFAAWMAAHIAAPLPAERTPLFEGGKKKSNLAQARSVARPTPKGARSTQPRKRQAEARALRVGHV